MILFSTIWFSCEEKDLNITDFEDEFGNYKSELKVEGLLQQDKPEDSIIRIIRTSSITDTKVYNGKDDDGDGTIDELDEILSLIQDTSATVRVINLNSGEEIDFQYIAVADSFLYWEDEELSDESMMVSYGGYKPQSNNFQIESFDQYQIEIYSQEFDKTITGVTTVYPPVDFIDTLFTFEEDVVTMQNDDEKEIFWKSDLNVTAYYITYEELYPIIEDEWESEFLFSYKSARDNELTQQYENVSIGHEIIWGADAGKVLKLTVEALSSEYGQYIFSSLPLKDSQRSNLRDEVGNPVMGCFGATAAKSIYIVIEE
jgi:hypothetical protein